MPPQDPSQYAFLTSKQKADMRGPQTLTSASNMSTAANPAPAVPTYEPTPSAQTAPIAADTLTTPQKPIEMPPQQPADPITFNPSAAIASSKDYLKQLSNPEEANLSAIDQQLATLGVTSKAQTRASAYDQYKVAALTDTVNNLTGELENLNAQYDNVPSQVNDVYSASDALQGFVDARTRAVQDRIATKARLKAAEAQAAQGKLTSAKQLADQYVEDTFADETRKEQLLKDQRQRVLDAYNRGDIKLSKAQELAIKEQESLAAQREKQLTEKKDEKKTILGYALDARAVNAPDDIVQKIINSKTREEAIMAAGPYVKKTAPQTSYIDAGGRKLLVDDATGEILADLGTDGSAITSANQMTDNERALFGQFRGEQIVKDFNNIVGQKLAFDKVITNGVGGPADLAMVYMFMKGLDPSSVVRETEYATASQSGNIFQGIFAKYNGYLKEEGGFLPNNVKLEFQNLVNQRLSAQKMQYDNLKSQYGEMAQRQGMNPANVTLDYQAVLDGYNPTAPQGQGAGLDTFYITATPEQRARVDELLLTNTPEDQILMQVSGKLPQVPAGKTIRVSQGAIPAPALDVALSQIREEEGLRLKAYKDQVGVWTIGYGNTKIDGRPVKQGDTITREQADEMLRTQAVNNYTNFANYVDRPMTPNQVAALMSFEYNLGSGIWTKPAAKKIITDINNGDFQAAAEKLQAFNTGRDQSTGKRKVLPVLVARRKREGSLLTS